jgi:uncharacterized caspase-like protein
MHALRIAYLAAALIVFSAGCYGQQKSSIPTSQEQARRVALVIGNAAYKNGKLANPVNDARAMAARLRTLGFDVVLREDLLTRDIGGVYREFRSKIVPGAVALVFYAGHGVQIKGQNYFPTVDSNIDSEEDVPLQSLNLGTLLDNMEEAKAGVSLVFLDACRDNPFARRFRSNARGLAKVEASSGTLIHYATKPGSVADDGQGKNGTYTTELLAQMSEPGVPVELMLKQVANRVVAKTNGKQEPWMEGSLRGDFYFIFTGPATVNVQPMDPEGEAWKAAERAGTVEAVEAYLKEYPKATYAAAARIKLASLRKAEPALRSDTTLTKPPESAMPLRGSDARRFDGNWELAIDCSGVKDATGYLKSLLVVVTDGALTGSAGVQGQADSLQISGQIQPDGVAILEAKGRTGPPKYSLGGVPPGTPYGFRSLVRFEGTRGTGRRDNRPCDLLFVKR